MKNVLIVDDEVRLLKSLEAGLTSYEGQFAVLTANNGNQALDILQQEKVDLLITDLRMPEMDGFELLAHISTAHPFMPSIVMTAFATPEIEERVNLTGTAKLLEKPIDFEKLAKSILEGLAQESKEGAVAGLSLANFLQLLALEQKTCLLKIHAGDTDGYIYLMDGEIHSAITKDFQGEEALFLLLACDDSRISFKKTPKKKMIRMISKPLMSLLMEGMRRKDEIQFNLDEQEFSSDNSYSQQQKTASATPENQRSATTIKSAKGEVDMSNLNNTLSKLTDVEGFMAVGIFTPNGEMAADVNTSNLKLAEIGSLANDVLLKAQKATDVMNVGRGKVVHIDAPKAHIIARCLNEADNYSQTESGKAHIHIVLLISKEGNLAMAKIKMESLLPEIASSFR